MSSLQVPGHRSRGSDYSSRTLSPLGQGRVKKSRSVSSRATSRSRSPARNRGLIEMGTLDATVGMGSSALGTTQAGTSQDTHQWKKYLNVRVGPPSQLSSGKESRNMIFDKPEAAAVPFSSKQHDTDDETGQRSFNVIGYPPGIDSPIEISFITSRNDDDQVAIWKPDTLWASFTGKLENENDPNSLWYGELDVWRKQGTDTAVPAASVQSSGDQLNSILSALASSTK